MNDRELPKNKTSVTPPVATQASSSLLRRQLTSEVSESVGSNSNISKELGGIQPKTIRRSLNWQNISVEAPSRGNGMSLPGGIQRQQEELPAVIGDRVEADSVQKSPLESSNSTISTDLPAQKPLIARAPFNGRNIPVEAPSRSSASSTYPGGIQRLETSEVKEQEKSTDVKSPETGVKPPETKAEVKAPGSEVESSTAGQSKMATGAANGKDPTPDTIREGSVRMEEHPQYQDTLREVREAGFEIKFSDDYVCVEVKEVVDSDGNVIRVEKTLYVQENMRYLDLEHELGHIKQQERFGGNMLTKRVIEKNGREKESKIKDGILTIWQDTITEYHNRLDEFIRLYERGASPELLKEHAQGVEKWYGDYRKKGLKNGNSQSQKQWADKYFPDIDALRSRYLAIVRTIEQ